MLKFAILKKMRNMLDFNIIDFIKLALCRWNDFNSVAWTHDTSKYYLKISALFHEKYHL